MVEGETLVQERRRLHLPAYLATLSLAKAAVKALANGRHDKPVFWLRLPPDTSAMEQSLPDLGMLLGLFRNYVMMAIYEGCTECQICDVVSHGIERAIAAARRHARGAAV